MLHRTGEHVRDRLDAPVGMPREAGEIVLWAIVPEVVEEEKRVEVGRRAEAERATESHTRALQGGFGLHKPLHVSHRHVGVDRPYAQVE